MNLFNISIAYSDKLEKDWDKVYWMVDVHNTIFPGLYDISQDFVFYRDAKEVLQFLSNKNDVVLIMYTCSHLREISKMYNFFKENNVCFDFLNKNPEIPNTALGDYTDKPYFNILLDDKAGFEPSDWKLIKELLSTIYGDKI